MKINVTYSPKWKETTFSIGDGTGWRVCRVVTDDELDHCFPVSRAALLNSILNDLLDDFNSRIELGEKALAHEIATTHGLRATANVEAVKNCKDKHLFFRIGYPEDKL